MQEKWLNTAEAAKYLGCSRSLLNQDRVKGLLKIPFTKLGRRVLYSVSDLNAFLEARKCRWDGAA